MGANIAIETPRPAAALSPPPTSSPPRSSLLLPRRPLSPTESFQARFLVGAAVLAIVVAVPSALAAVRAGGQVSALFISLFALAQVVHLVALRQGARLALLVWSELSVLALFLTAQSLITDELQPSQLRWLVMIPLASLVLVGPRARHNGKRSSRRPALLGAGVAIALGCFIIFAHEVGLTLGRHATSSLLVTTVDFVMFMVAAGGLVLLYDRAARETFDELRTLRRLLAVCAWCKRIRDEGAWVGMDHYLTTHVSALTHGICPDCERRHFAE